ncbi:MAG: hypothetical protein AAF466_08120 [Bacteroidota bacterium]
MKNLFLFLAVSSTILFTSCEGPEGPPGEPGINILGQVFEVTVDFTVGNDFQQLITIPNNVEVFESDAILVYWLEDVVPGGGGTVDLWSPLPQTIYLDGGGSFQYTFNHSFVDVLLFLQGDVDLSTLGNGFTNDQTFRIAVVPSEFADANLTMDQLMSSGEVEFIGL